MRLRIRNTNPRSPRSVEWTSQSGEVRRISVPPVGGSVTLNNVDPYGFNEDPLFRAIRNISDLSFEFLPDADDVFEVPESSADDDDPNVIIGTLTAGSGLTGGGDMSENITIAVDTSGDGSIVDNTGLEVGQITNAQHGDRSGGSLHATATSSAAGFMSTADKDKLDLIEDGAEVNTVDSVFGRTGAVTAAAGDYTAAEVDFDNTATDITATNVQVALVELDAAAIQSDVDGQIDALNDKAAPVSADLALIEDSAAAFAKAAVSLGSIAGLARPLNIQLFTTVAPNTYTPTPGTTSAIVIAQGGGGAGGNGVATSAGNISLGNGGPAGAVGIRRYDIDDQVTGTANVGGAGFDSTFIYTGQSNTTGGGASPGGATIGNASAPAISEETIAARNGNGTVIIAQGNGGSAVRLSGTVGVSGSGGASLFGSGGRGRTTDGAGNEPEPESWGAGGGGGLSANGSPLRAGGAGRSGAIMVIEFGS